MKKSIICSLALMFAFTVYAFCEDNVVKQSSQKSSVATTTVAKETKSAVDTVKKDVAAAEKKVSADAAKISADAKSTINDAKKTVETAEQKAVTEAKSAADTAKTAVAATEEKIAAETKSAVDGAKKDVAATEEKIATEAESVANAAKKDVKTAEENVVKETKTAVNDVKKDVAKVEENKKQTEDIVTKETPKTVKEEPAKAVAKDNAVAEKSGNKKIFNYSKDSSKTEIEIKVGRTVNAKPEIARESVDVDDVYTVGIEVVAYSNSFIGLGAGIYNVFDSKIKKDGVTIVDRRPEGNNGEYKIAFTNPYLTLKSKILQFDSNIIRNVYIFGQIGYGFMRIENAYETEDGMYWGVGGGIDIWHFLVDVNYATNFGKIKMNHGEKKVDVRQSTIIVSLGYRFSL